MPELTEAEEDELVPVGLLACQVILDAAGITKNQLRSYEAFRAVAWMALQDARFLVGLQDFLHAVQDAEAARSPYLESMS